MPEAALHNFAPVMRPDALLEARCLAAGGLPDISYCLACLQGERARALLAPACGRPKIG